MKRWKSKLASAALLTTLGGAGCKQQLYMHEVDHQGVMSNGGIPRDLDSNPGYSVVPSPRNDIKIPPTVNDPDQPARQITLQEALMIGLEQGSVGNNGTSGIPSLSAGRLLINDDLVGFTGSGVSGDDHIRAFALDPAIFGANIEGALAKFDARWVTSMNWQKTDQSTQALFAATQNGDSAAFSSGIVKPLPTGGVAGITFNTDYSKLNSTVQTPNPAYRPSATVSIEQPLLKDYGVDINQVTPSFPQPNTIANFRSSGGRSEGILLTRVRYEQQKLAFERNVNIILFDIENAYWNLYASYFALYANDQGLRQSFETWRLTKVLVDAGVRAKQDLDQVRARFEQFRASRLASLQSVLEAERQMRGLLGMSVVDGFRLVPADTPTQAIYSPDYKDAYNEMLMNRPELNLVRQELKARQLDILVQKNGLRPDLRFNANYNVNALGNRLDGSTPNGNALGGLAENKFNNWQMGLRLDVPLGYRDANSSLRVAQLNLARTYITLKNQELKAERFLAVSYQQLTNQYMQIKSFREQRVALGEQLALLFTKVQLGKEPLLTILDAQRDFANAIQQEHQSVANYNVAIAGFQYAKGTLMNYDNVTIAEGPLPSAGLTPAHELHKKNKGRFDKVAAAPVPTQQAMMPEIPAAAPVVMQPAPTIDTATMTTPAAIPASVAVPQMTGNTPAQPASAPAMMYGESGRPVITVTSGPGEGTVPPQSPLLPPGMITPPALIAVPTSNPK